MEGMRLRPVAPRVLVALALAVLLAGCGRAARTDPVAQALGGGVPVEMALRTPLGTHARTDAGAAGGTAAQLAHDRWHVLARSPLGTRYSPVVAWTGSELLELGGTVGGRFGGGSPRAGGAAYDPSDGRWQRVAAVPAGVLPGFAVSTWTGTEEFVFGEPTQRGERPTDLAGLFDPASNRWTVTPRAPLSPLGQTVAASTGTEVILAGLTTHDDQLQMASFTPASGRWQRLEPPLPDRHPPMAIAMVDTNDGVLVWSLWGRSVPVGPHTVEDVSGVDVLRLSASGVWTNVTGSWPQHDTVDQPLFTGTRVLLGAYQDWCGACAPPALQMTHGREVDPRSLRITPVPQGPLDEADPQIAWTGSAEIALDMSGEVAGPHVSIRPGDIAFWNPATRRWRRGARAPRALSGSPATWDGRSLLVLAQDGRLLAYGP